MKIDKEKIAQEFEFDIEDVEMLLDIFCENTKISLEKIKNAIEISDYETLFTSAHTIKGSAGNLMLNSISDLAKEIETSAKKQQAINYEDLYQLLKKEVETVE